MKLILITSSLIILLLIIGIFIYKNILINSQDKEIPTIQYSAPIGPTLDGKGLESQSILNKEVNK